MTFQVPETATDYPTLSLVARIKVRPVLTSTRVLVKVQARVSKKSR